MSRKLCIFLVLTVIVNVILTYGLIFHRAPPSAARCASYIQAQCPQLALPAVSNTARMIQPPLGNHEMAAEEDTETTALAVRSPGEFSNSKSNFKS